MPEKDRYIDERAAPSSAPRSAFRRSGTRVGNERRRASRALGRWPLTAMTSLTAPSSEQPVARLRATSSADGRQWCRRPPTGCSVAGLTPLTRRDIGVVPGLGPGRLQLPFARAEPEPRLVTAVRYRLRLGRRRPPSQHRPRRCCAKPNDAAFPATNCSPWPRGDGPNPSWHPSPARPGNAGWSAAPAGPGRTAHAAKPSACSSRSANRDRAAGAAPSAATTGPHPTKQQHKHDHDDQHPQPCRQDSLLGRRRGSWRRRYCRPPEQATRSRPGDLPGPDRRAGPGGAEPFGPCPASPAQP
jgi:hypothetical protein